jgi:site-specific DNA-methyltransferase (adenine-specific)
MIGNTLFYGDNLNILREKIADECVDLIYLDPPFNSKADYNILYKETTGKPSEAQITAFEDTWHWGEDAERTFQEIIDKAPAHLIEMMRAFRQFMGSNDMMAYLTMMCIRLIELHRVLKPTGSLYLHCDPTASHYLKILMDTIFGKKNFRNEIIWKRSQPKSHMSLRFSNSHDVILTYAKSDKTVFHSQYRPHDPDYVEKFYRFVEPETGRRYRLGDLTNPNKNRPNLTYEFPPGSGVTRVWRWTKDRMMKAWKDGLVVMPKDGGVAQCKRYLDDMEGSPVTDIWDDIEHLHGMQKELLGYPTQKPEALLERILNASSEEGGVVLDPFCGCGTTITAAQKTKRSWIGIDVTHLAINLIKWRLKHMFSLEPRKDYKVIGEPEDLAGAMELASQNRYQFQWWATSLIDARPYGDKKKGSDTGIDGFIYFNVDKDKFGKGIVSVKSGKVSVKDIRDLGHVMDREKAEISIFVTLQSPTRDMVKEAVSKGLYRSPISGEDYQRIQIFTVEDLLGGKKPDIPHQVFSFKKAEKHEGEENLGLFEGK